MNEESPQHESTTKAELSMQAHGLEIIVGFSFREQASIDYRKENYVYPRLAFLRSSV